jgi:hypothetical protein
MPRMSHNGGRRRPLLRSVRVRVRRSGAKDFARRWLERQRHRCRFWVAHRSDFLFASRLAALGLIGERPGLHDLPSPLRSHPGHFNSSHRTATFAATELRVQCGQRKARRLGSRDGPDRETASLTSFVCDSKLLVYTGVYPTHLGQSGVCEVPPRAGR